MYPYSVNMYVIIIIIIVKNGIFLVFRFGKDVLFTKVKWEWFTDNGSGVGRLH